MRLGASPTTRQPTWHAVDWNSCKQSLRFQIGKFTNKVCVGFLNLLNFFERNFHGLRAQDNYQLLLTANDAPNVVSNITSTGPTSPTTLSMRLTPVHCK